MFVVDITHDALIHAAPDLSIVASLPVTGSYGSLLSCIVCYSKSRLSASIFLNIAFSFISVSIYIDILMIFNRWRGWLRASSFQLVIANFSVTLHIQLQVLAILSFTNNYQLMFRLPSTPARAASAAMFHPWIVFHELLQPHSSYYIQQVIFDNQPLAV